MGAYSSTSTASVRQTLTLRDCEYEAELSSRVLVYSQALAVTHYA